MGLLLLAVGWILTWSFAPHPVFAQADHKDQANENLLPATTGEPLTIAPLDMPDIDCAVAQWNANAPKPVLTLLCPPGEVFAPLHVLIKLSWIRPEDAGVNPAYITAPLGAATKIRTSRTAALVWLRVGGKERGQPHAMWVGFTGVVDVALLVGRPKR